MIECQVEGWGRGGGGVTQNRNGECKLKYLGVWTGGGGGGRVSMACHLHTNYLTKLFHSSHAWCHRCDVMQCHKGLFITKSRDADLPLFSGFSVIFGLIRSQLIRFPFFSPTVPFVKSACEYSLFSPISSFSF